MAQIIATGQVNVPALGADDAYVQIIAPPPYIVGAPTDVIGVVGGASWGPVNVPVHLGSGLDAVQAFGPMSAASLIDPHDLATDLYIAFGQSSSQATLEGFGVRVTDGTDTAASYGLQGAVSPAGKSATVAGTVTPGDTLTLTFSSASLPNNIAVAYEVLAGDTLATIAAGLAAAVNANGVLQATQITAQAAGAAVNTYAPGSVTFTLAESTSGGATETLTIGVAAATTTGGTIVGLFTGSLGNQLKIVIGTGTQPNTFNVTMLPPVGLPETYPNIPGATFWSSLASAINQGQSTQRGKSQCVLMLNATPAVGAPSTGTFTLSGGTDGRANLTTANLLGSATATPQTGLFSLSGVQPAVGIAWIAGLTDLSAASTLLAFNQSAGVSSLISHPPGTSSAAAIANWQGTGVADASVLPCKDFTSFFDPQNNVTRRITPAPFIGGTWATLGPQQSPGNKPVNLVVGTERNDPITGTVPYTESEVAQLEATGIMFLTNPIPRGRMFGIRHGQSSSANPVTQPAEYWRMTMYLARSAASFIGQFVDEEQSTDPDDPVRKSFRLLSNQFLKQLKGQRQIDSFLVTCAFSSSPSATPGNGMNTPDSIAAHYMFALWQVRYLSSIRFLVLSLQGGTTVVEVSGTLQQQPVNL